MWSLNYVWSQKHIKRHIGNDEQRTNDSTGQFHYWYLTKKKARWKRKRICVRDQVGACGLKGLSIAQDASFVYVVFLFGGLGIKCCHRFPSPCVLCSDWLLQNISYVIWWKSVWKQGLVVSLSGLKVAFILGKMYFDWSKIFCWNLDTVWSNPWLQLDMQVFSFFLLVIRAGMQGELALKDFAWR